MTSVLPGHSDRMDVIVDIQCLKDAKNIATPKEVAHLSLNGNYTAHWIVAPSAKIDHFSQDIREENNWLKNHHHGLDYFAGEISQRSSNTIFKKMTKTLEECLLEENKNGP